MLQCLSLKPSSGRPPSIPTYPPSINLHSPPLPPPSSHGSSTEETPLSSLQQSPAVNLHREYTLTTQTNSYNEMWSRIHVNEDETVTVDHQFQFLNPNRESVEEVLRHATPSYLTGLVSTYFDQSEHATHLCFHLRQCLSKALSLYGPLRNLLEILPVDLDSMSQSQCDAAYDVFREFDLVDNPFPDPASSEFQEIKSSFSELQEQLNHCLRKSRSKVRMIKRSSIGCALCVFGSLAAVAVTAALVTTHTLLAIVACPFCNAGNLPCNLVKKENANVEQLDAAARVTYVLSGELDTIDPLVSGLYSAIEGDRNLIRLGLESGRDRFPILEVLKELRKTLVKSTDLLNDLEKHIVICFNTVNRARGFLLHEVHRYQSSNS